MEVESEEVSFYTVKDIARILKVSTATVYILIDKKELNALRIGGKVGQYRIEKENFQEYLKSKGLRLVKSARG